ncbi:sigma-54-dependent Fis family transcriptional regulator [candidate division WOR-3 bacterium]|nr:sigma-54-dependent Fis family transcriptional regulator [candidate division WOR-3 bacterium]
MSPESADRLKILVVDDEPGFLRIADKALRGEGCEVTTADNTTQALEYLESRFFDVVVSDVKMPGMDGIELVRKLRVQRPTLEVVMVSGHADARMAIEVMKLGVFDFLLKPLEIEDLIRVVFRAARKGYLEKRNLVLEKELQRSKGTATILGASAEIEQVRAFVARAASSDLPVLITGESGTGKELVAQAIHEQSPRHNQPLVIVDSSTLRRELIDSELFGHEKGAFTGAITRKAGLFEVADKGTVFLDEIGELSSENQASLLRVLETGTFRPVGSVKEIYTDVRIIAATNRDIQKCVSDGEFREDLYYRLKGLILHIPPLRQRPCDVGPLVEHFLDRYNEKTSGSVKVSKAALCEFEKYKWPGNVRELRHVVELAALLACEEETMIEPLHLPQELQGAAQSGASSLQTGWSIPVPDSNPTFREFQLTCEHAYISRLLAEFGGNKQKVARALDISPSVLYAKLEKLGLYHKNK